MLCSECRTGCCIVCGKEFKRYDLKRECCSKQCASIWRKQSGGYQRQIEKTKQTCLEKYGVDNPFKSEEIKQRIEQTNLEKYGVKSFSQTDDFKEKCRQTNLEKYGVENPAQNPEIQEKMRKTNLERYGVEYASQTKEFQEKTRQTNLERYGVENAFQNEEIRRKANETKIEKYDGIGYDSEEISAKIKNTMKERYGVECSHQNSNVVFKSNESMFQSFLEKMDVEHKEKYRCFHENPREFILNNFDYKPIIQEIADLTGVCYSTIEFYVLHCNCSSLVRKSISIMEDQVVDFLISIDDSIDIVRNCRSMIYPQELDIYLPEYKIGIECNPTYTHNSSVPSFGVDQPLPSNYHQQKSFICEEKGIFLFHIFGWEWSQKKDIIKSMIRNLLRKCDKKYYARKLKVTEVNQSICFDFLNNNHRQGSVISSINLGLVTEDNELVSVMTFNKMRPGIGKKENDTDKTWELLRFCSKLNTIVVGGASKLFSYFVNKFHPEKIVSYSDIAHTRGNLYSILGFEKVSISDPGYCYVYPQTDSILSREKCQKKKLQNMFPDEILDMNKSEREIMEEHGFVRLFDSGSIRWEWKR